MNNKVEFDARAFRKLSSCVVNGEGDSFIEAIEALVSRELAKLAPAFERTAKEHPPAYYELDLKHLSPVFVYKTWYTVRQVNAAEEYTGGETEIWTELDFGGDDKFPIDMIEKVTLHSRSDTCPKKR